MRKNDATPIEAIDFEPLQQTPEQSKESDQSVNSKLFLWLAFIFLLICALVVFLFLPKFVAEKKENPIPDEQAEVRLPEPEAPYIEPSKEISPTLSPQELNALKLEAEELLLQLIEKQKFLDNKAVKKWAQEEFSVALTLGSNGDEHFRKQEYQHAITSYKDAVTVLNDLEKQIAPTLAKHLQKGEQALTQAEKASAIHHFELAKAIDENNTQAINGLKRAQTIEELYSLLDKGGKLEAANRLADAKNIYQQATELDPLSSEAKTALNRVSSRLAQIEFSRLINQGYASLKQRQYGDARAAFTAAQKLSPNSDKPKQGLASIEQAMRSEKLTALEAEAQHFENLQDWSNAVKSYQQMISISPNLSAAQQGLQRSLQRESVFSRINEHIENKLRLSSESVANDANQLLQEVALINHPGSKIEQAATTLKELLRQANQPIAITLQSDNQTDVAIYKVGKFGKFETRKIELKPGKYTIVGSRSGFRDVRKIITVLTDMSEKTISVRCEEPI